MIHAISRGGLGLIVVERGGEILGIITDGDIRRAMESRQSAFFDIHPMEIATREPKTIRPESKLIEAEREMTQHKVNSLLVVDDNQHLVGVIQIYDIKL
jgi:arabinose-5-phosphate isomerase